MSKQLVTGAFETADEADDAINDLIDAGFLRDEISVIMSDTTRAEFEQGGHVDQDTASEVARDAAGGGMIGGTLGAIIAGTLATTGSIGAAVVTGGAAIPFIAGPLAAALAGGGAGAAAGSVIGALAGLGYSHDDAAKYERALDGGSFVVAVEVEAPNAETAREILRSAAPAVH